MENQGSELDQEIDEENSSKSVKTQSPTQPGLLSQRQQFLDEAAQEAVNSKGEPGKNAKCSIEEMLGEKLVDISPQENKESLTEKKSKTKKNKKVEGKSKFEITNNEEKISNSSTPIENEKLRSQADKKKNKNKIEIDFEMTEEMKK